MKTVGLVGKIVMAAIVVIGLVLALLMGIKGEILAEAVNPNASADGSWTGVIITFTICAFGLGILGLLVDFLLGLNLKTWIIVVAIVAFTAFLYLVMADGTPMKLVGYEGTDNQSPWLEIADTGIFLFYTSAGLAVISIIYSEIRQLFR